MLSDRILRFLLQLKIQASLPRGVQGLYPYQNPAVQSICEQFYNKYYSDNDERHLILGINPGRHGGGITGVPFTDPIKLQDYCGIPNSLVKKAELSADFIYAMISSYGGPELFYKNFYISSISPIGFTKGGKNLNYYDIPLLESRVRPFIIESLKIQIKMGMRTDTVFCLGEGSNFKYLSRLNDQHHFFNAVVPLAHPRFIMQYRRKKMSTFLQEYISQLTFGKR